MNRLKIMTAAIAALLMAAMWSCSGPVPEGRFVIEGNLKGADGHLRLLTRRFALADTTISKNGRFRFEGEVTEPALMFIVKPGTAQPMLAGLFVESGKRIKISGNVAEGEERRIKVSGSEMNETYYHVMEEGRRISEDTLNRAPAERDSAVLAIIEPAMLANTDNVMGEVLLSNIAKFYSPRRMLEILDRFPRQRRDSSLQLLSLEGWALTAIRALETEAADSSAR